MACELRQEEFDSGNKSGAEIFDAWFYVAVRYSLRVLGLRPKFCRMVARDPMYAKLVLPSLERRGCGIIPPHTVRTAEEVLIPPGSTQGRVA